MKKRSNISHLPLGFGNYEWLVQNIKNEFKKRCKSEYLWQVKYQSTSRLQVLAIAADAIWKARNWGGGAAAVGGSALKKVVWRWFLISYFHLISILSNGLWTQTVAYFKRINFSMLQRGVYSLHFCKPVSWSHTPLPKSCSISWRHVTSTRITQPQLNSLNLIYRLIGPRSAKIGLFFGGSPEVFASWESLWEVVNLICFKK